MGRQIVRLNIPVPTAMIRPPAPWAARISSGVSPRKHTVAPGPRRFATSCMPFRKTSTRNSQSSAKHPNSKKSASPAAFNLSQATVSMLPEHKPRSFPDALSVFTRSRMPGKTLGAVSVYVLGGILTHHFKSRSHIAVDCGSRNIQSLKSSAENARVRLAVVGNAINGGLDAIDVEQRPVQGITMGAIRRQQKGPINVEQVSVGLSPLKAVALSGSNIQPGILR